MGLPFLSKLEDNFGPHDPVGDAEKSLHELTMKKGAHIVKYNVDFWELASRVSWNEAALCDRYFRGLPLCLCTEVLRGGKPTTLAALRLKAQDADNIYWMQEEESRPESQSSGNNGNLGKKDSNKTIIPLPKHLPTLRATIIAHRPNLRKAPLRISLRTQSPTSWARMASSPEMNKIAI